MTSAFFRSLDSSFIHFSDTNENPPLLYKSTDCYVQKFFELPIPMLGGSTVKYHFTTNGGDISFLTKFYNKGNSEVVFGPSRVPSDQEAYTGQYKSTKDGTLILYFDNNFSWFTPKYLTYHVEVFQPAFTAADNARCLRSRSMLKVCVEDTRNAEGSLSESRVKMKELNTIIPSMENRLNILKTELASKKAILQRAYDEAEEMAARIEANLDKKNGLCIRYVANPRSFISLLSSLSLSLLAATATKIHHNNETVLTPVHTSLPPSLPPSPTLPSLLHPQGSQQEAPLQGAALPRHRVVCADHVQVLAGRDEGCQRGAAAVVRGARHNNNNQLATSAVGVASRPPAEPGRSCRTRSELQIR
jgi:hypothetical protein